MALQADAVQGKRILLVEDERAVREALRLLLCKDAHIVVEANNGAEAFALFVGSKFDLVMTDFEMPFVKGDELATKIKRVAPQQPILMVTAFDHRPNFQNPVDAVMKKPLDCARLRETMNTLLSQPYRPRFNVRGSQTNRTEPSREEWRLVDQTCPRRNR
jgi:YesN/AraC family two-component response regulator